jgi:hypothetical protein
MKELCSLIEKAANLVLYLESLWSDHRALSKWFGDISISQIWDNHIEEEGT